MEGYPNWADVDVTAATEPLTLPKGTEAHLQITRIQPIQDKYCVQVFCLVVDQPEVRDVQSVLFYPKPDDEPSKRNNKLRALKRFAEGFNVPLTGGGAPDLSQVIGAEGWAILDEEEDPTYGKRNTFGAFGIQRLKQ